MRMQWRNMAKCPTLPDRKTRNWWRMTTKTVNASTWCPWTCGIICWPWAGPCGPEVKHFMGAFIARITKVAKSMKFETLRMHLPPTEKGLQIRKSNCIIDL